MAAKKKVDGRTKVARAIKASPLKGKRVPNAKRGGRPVGGRLPKLGDIVRIVKGGEKHALGVIGNEDGKHWIVYEDRSDLALRVRKNSVRLATIDERHLHLRKLVAIDVAIATFEEGAYERDASKELIEDDDDVEDVWESGAFPEGARVEWGLTKEENNELADLLVKAHQAHNGESYEREETVKLSTGKTVAFVQSASADAVDADGSYGFEYKPLLVVDVGTKDVEEVESEQTEALEAEEKAEEELPTLDDTLASIGILDARETDAVQSAFGD